MRGDAKMAAAAAKSQRTGNARNTRPLGSIRVGNPVEATTSVPKFPQIVAARGDLQAVIHGNAMAVPPQKLATEALRSESEPRGPRTHSCSPTKSPSPRKRSVTGSSKSDSSSVVNGRSEELEKARSDLKDAMVRERELKQEIMQLHKDMDELRQVIWDKDKLIKDMQEQFVRQEEKYKELYEKEQASHGETQKQLGKVTTELTESKMTINKMTTAHQKELENVNKQHLLAMEEQRVESQREIALRDEKLGKLKKQMADALQGNSWERQQQLDELSKELTRVQEEADLLRMRLKASKTPKPGACMNCDVLSTQLTQAQKQAKDKDRTIQDLTLRARKSEMKPTPRLDSNQKLPVSSRGKLK